MNSSSLRTPAFWAAALPVACAVHCLLTPLAALAVPVLAPSSGFETGLMAVSAVLALAVTARGVRVHGRRAVWLPVLAGLALWAASRALAALPAAETATTLAGSLLLAVGMARNARLRHEAACHHCACPAHEH